MKSVFAGAALAASLSAVALAAASVPLKGSRLLPQAKVSLAQARAVALQKEPGTIVAQELEKEKGALRFTFDIVVGKVVHEVGVDAVKGTIVEDSIDNAND